VTFVYPLDPLGPKVSGIATFIRDFIRKAPRDLEIELVGITCSPRERPVGTWQELQLGDTKFRFFPLLHEPDENRRRFVPLSLRFTHALRTLQGDLDGRLLLFNRIEPAWLFRSAPMPRIGFVHNDIVRQMEPGSENSWKHFPWLYFRMEKKLLPTLDYVYTVNRNAADFYRARYPELEGRLEFLPSWVDERVFYPGGEATGPVRDSLGWNGTIPRDPPWLLFVGRLQQQKAPVRLIETLHAYSKFEPDAQLVIVGEGDLKGAMTEAARSLGVEDRVHFTGALPQEDVARFYRAADCLLLTSHFEGMPCACVEALGSGLPVVATDAGETSQVILSGRSGEIVRDFSAQAMAQAIDKVVSNPSQYSADHCLKSVSNYHAQDVLEGLYAHCRKLYRRSSHCT
jgi:glycosyltransferase involved in cell wall biosynthesis